jgi:hypothetical protein
MRGSPEMYLKNITTKDLVKQYAHSSPDKTSVNIEIFSLKASLKPSLVQHWMCGSGVV